MNPFYTLIHWAVSAIALLLTAYFMPGFRVDGFGSALIAALVIGLANIFIWPILIFFTLPINIITFGLFTFVVNGIVLKICAALLPGFSISSWFSAIFGAILLTIISSILHRVFV